MFPSVETGTLAGHPFVRTGDGPRTLVVIPGLNDPLHTVGDSWWFPRLMAVYLGRYADTHTAYMVSRPHGIQPGTTVADMARDYEAVLDALDAEETPVDVMGLSMGGFLLQALAASDDRVDRAVLGLSAARLGDEGRAVVERWRDWGERGRWGPIYREAYGIVADGVLARVLQTGSVGYDLLYDPVDPQDFLVSADACLAFDGRDLLPEMDCPTLVVGGDADVFFTAADYREAVGALPAGTLAMLRGAGHESVIEHPDAFDGSIRRFLRD
ncbi:alpha/beta fold hydrolase [Haloarchaeobius amylolyticus]|uniref:alpha/beta fold hydrolase n=1 Tax=Haloarchaeobius amylolyticus TaxID=1198296 RepID=UPI0022721A63